MIFTSYNGSVPYYKNAYFLVFYIFLCGSFMTASATSKHDAIEEDLFSEIPVVLSVTRLEQPVTHAPAAVTIIDSDMIEASGARTIPELLRHVPGFYVGYDEGDIPVTTYHGFAEQYARRIQILVDGRSVYQPSLFGITWADLPLIIEDIDRIEVIRTPNTASYGANAFLATISIHTKKPPEKKQTYFKTLYGKYDERRFVVKHGDQQGNLNYNLSLAFEKDDLYGHVETAVSPLYYDPDVERRFDRRRFTTVAVNSNYRATSNDQITAHFGVLKGVSGEGNYSHPSKYLEIYDARILSHYQQLKWVHKNAPDNDVSIQLYHNSHDREDNYIELQDLDYPASLNKDIETERYDIELVHRLEPFTNTRIAWGVSSRWDQVDSKHFFLSTNPAKYSMRSVFTNIEWQPAPWITSNLGIMHENNSFTGEDTSPRLGINLSINPKHTLRFILSKAIRVPSTVEELADRQTCLNPPTCTNYDEDWLGNPNVRAEKIVSKEFGYHIIFGKNSSIDLKAYRDTMKDILLYDTSSGRLSFINGDDVEISGAEIEADYRPDSRTRFHLSYADTDIDYKGPSDPWGYTRSSPRRIISFLANRKFDDGLSASLSYFYMNTHSPMGGDIIDKMDRVDIMFSQKFKSNDWRGKFAFNIQGLTGGHKDFDSDKFVEPTTYFSIELETD